MRIPPIWYVVPSCPVKNLTLSCWPVATARIFQELSAAGNTSNVAPPQALNTIKHEHIGHDNLVSSRHQTYTGIRRCCIYRNRDTMQPQHLPLRIPSRGDHFPPLSEVMSVIMLAVYGRWSESPPASPTTSDRRHTNNRGRKLATKQVFHQASCRWRCVFMGQHDQSLIFACRQILYVDGR